MAHPIGATRGEPLLDLVCYGMLPYMLAKKRRRGRREYGVEDEAGNTLIDPSATTKGAARVAAARLAEVRGESVYVFEVGEDNDGTHIVVNREEVRRPNEPPKSRAQIKREIDEVLTKTKVKPFSESSYLGGLRYKAEVYGPGGNRTIGEALPRPKVRKLTKSEQKIIDQVLDANKLGALAGLSSDDKFVRRLADAGDIVYVDRTHVGRGKGWVAKDGPLAALIGAL